jgi:hypothetical protein
MIRSLAPPQAAWNALPIAVQQGDGKPNRDFLSLNKIEDGNMRKNSTTAKLTKLEIQRNKAI